MCSDISGTRCAWGDGHEDRLPKCSADRCGVVVVHATGGPWMT